MNCDHPSVTRIQEQKKKMILNVQGDTLVPWEMSQFPMATTERTFSAASRFSDSIPKEQENVQTEQKGS